jgi:3-hydroxyacyl-CoA dehydrogenase
MSDPVTYQTRGAVAVITLANPPVNALGHALRLGLMAGLEQAAGDATVTAVVIKGDGRCFSAGADINEFGKPPAPPTLRDVIDAVEASPKPVVAAIHGVAFGGGLELALACHLRAGDGGARVSFPEVKLGLLPGAGGTQRLPRIIGAARALKIILSGAPVGADEALSLGILDEIIVGDLGDGAVAAAEKLAALAEPPRKVRDLTADGGTPELFAAERKRIERRSRGLIAPGLIIDSVENACTLPFDEGMKKEREYFEVCRESDQSRAQRYVFGAERAAAKVKDLAPETKARAVESLAIVGCGTMGAGITACIADAGLPVTVLETGPEALESGLAAIAKTYQGSVSRGRITQEQADARNKLIRGSTDYADLAEADMVIEAAFEDMDLKKEIFRELDEACKQGAILATNTSTLDIDRIAASTKRPGSVIGTHFFSPANVMKLMEIVRGKDTSPETIATVMALAKVLGKTGVLVGVGDGFVGNRMYYSYTAQANFLLEEGAAPEQVDRVMHGFGFPMGPFAVGDLAGLDVGWRVRQARAKTRPPAGRYSPIADRICERGRFGQKTNAGWYRYEDGSRKPVPDPEIEALIIGVSDDLGIERRSVTDEEIQDRCIYALINEGAKILDEGLVQRASDIDIVWIYGYGFPVWRGGPMYHAGRVGLDKVSARLAQLAEKHGPELAPAPLLEKLAAQGKTFADL